MPNRTLLLVGLASVSEAVMNETSGASLTQYCVGQFSADFGNRYEIVPQHEFCDTGGWSHKFTFYAFSSEQPGTSEYCVGVWNGGMKLDKQHYCGGGDWTHKFTFFAYDHPVSGADEYCVGFAEPPYRCVLSEEGHNCGSSGWTQQFNLYMYRDPGTMVTLTRQVLRSINYPDLDKVPPAAPVAVGTRMYCNAADFPQQFADESASKDIQLGDNHCFHWDYSKTGGYSSDVEMEISAGVPLFEKEKVTVSTHQEMSFTADKGDQYCHSTVETDKYAFKFPSVTLPAKTAEEYTFTQWQGQLSQLDYTAVLDQYWSNGTTTTTKVTGTYYGVSYSTVDQSYQNERTVDSCTGEVAAENVNII